MTRIFDAPRAIKREERHRLKRQCDRRRRRDQLNAARRARTHAHHQRRQRARRRRRRRAGMQRSTMSDDERCETDDDCVLERRARLNELSDELRRKRRYARGQFDGVVGGGVVRVVVADSCDVQTGVLSKNVHKQRRTAYTDTPDATVVLVATALTLTIVANLTRSERQSRRAAVHRQARPQPTQSRQSAATTTTTMMLATTNVRLRVAQRRSIAATARNKQRPTTTPTSTTTTPPPPSRERMRRAPRRAASARAVRANSRAWRARRHRRAHRRVRSLRGGRRRRERRCCLRHCSVVERVRQRSTTLRDAHCNHRIQLILLFLYKQ